MKVIFKKFISNSPPGTKIRVFGHNVIVQKNRTLMCDMDPEMAEIEVKAGRVILAEDVNITNRPAQVQQDMFDPELLKKYSGSRETAFGIGSLSDLKAHLKQEKLDVLKWFARTKLLMDLGTTSRAKAFSEISSVLDNLFNSAEKT